MNTLPLFDVGEPAPQGRHVPHNMRCVPGINGNGPIDETCGTCRHLVRKRGRYKKCELTRDFWTNGAGTDIRARWPACEKWEPKQQEKNDGNYILDSSYLILRRL